MTHTVRWSFYDSLLSLFDVWMEKCRSSHAKKNLASNGKTSALTKKKTQENQPFQWNKICREKNQLRVLGWKPNKKGVFPLCNLDIRFEPAHEMKKKHTKKPCKCSDKMMMHVAEHVISKQMPANTNNKRKSCNKSPNLDPSVKLEGFLILKLILMPDIIITNCLDCFDNARSKSYLP